MSPAGAADSRSKGQAKGLKSSSVGRFDKTVDTFLEAHLRGRPGLDRLMYGASSAGDHSLIWVGMALAEGLARSKGRDWRPAVRAGAALAAESVLVNGLVKLAFRRHRPERERPPPLPLRIPVTSSFPSGHASSAFFAAALLRSRSTWPLYYATAAVVASSRAYVRIHHASDVVAGALLGAALGELTRHFFPIWAQEERGAPAADELVHGKRDGTSYEQLRL
ncbi:MAG TPA: phosphatase PAP2 family protein [Acidimicrobiales bacterium]|nr:phosphatase PAP2 family protein [Acidimicrobiales bacterium]